MLFLVADEQFNVPRTHGFSVQAHGVLGIVRCQEANVSLSGGPSITSVGHDDSLRDDIMPLEELDNVILGGREGQSTHPQKASVLPDLDASPRSPKSWP